MHSKKIIRKLLRPAAGRGRMYGSWAALCIGLALLFMAAVAWVDFRVLLAGRERRDAMAEYVVIGKEITDNNMGRHWPGNLFSETEIKALLAIKGVEAVGRLESNRFPVTARLGGSSGFQTELFLESVPNDFLEHQSPDWHWVPGQATLPVILSNDFLNLYNYGFALSQGLPQLSPQSVKAIPFEIVIQNGEALFRAQVIGFTDRISSVLVPESFMRQMNHKYSLREDQQPARLMLKVKDPSDKTFVSYLETKGYTVNAEQLRWSRIRSAVQIIVSAVGAVALLIVGMGILSFILFLELTVYRAADPIRLMQQIGYAPRYLRRVLSGYFIPWVTSAVLMAAFLALAAHVALSRQVSAMALQLDISDAWLLPVAAAVFILLLLFLLHRATRLVLKSL